MTNGDSVILGCALVQVISHRHLNVVDQVKSQINSSGISEEQIGIEAGFLQELLSPVNSHLLKHSNSLIFVYPEGAKWIIYDLSTKGLSLIPS